MVSDNEFSAICGCPIWGTIFPSVDPTPKKMSDVDYACFKLENLRMMKFDSAAKWPAYKRYLKGQLSRENSLIGSKQRERLNENLDTFLPRRRGNPTTHLLRVQMINIVLDVNWMNRKDWRHVALEWSLK
jgi:hypothetical protein